MSKLVYGTPEYISIKNEILKICGVLPTDQFDVQTAIRSRINYLKNQIIYTGLKGFVLGISGGVDSSATGRLCQIACEELRAEGVDATFISMRLPAGIQLDEEDAQSSIKFINADKSLTINVGEAANNLSIQGVEQFEAIEKKTLTDKQVDFNKGNIKARLRMVAQYQVAAMYNALVIGTDHSSENATGFFTKFGDGACDLIVLNGLNKTQVRLVAKELGAPKFLYEKQPTADLEELNPGKLDDEGFGFPYWKLDLFLEGKEIDQETESKIIQQYLITQHKRAPIVNFS
jgi:NAD+ synthase